MRSLAGRVMIVQVRNVSSVGPCQIDHRPGSRDRSDAREGVLVDEDVGLGGAEVVDRGGHVAGVSDLDGVDEELQAEGVAMVVVLVGGELAGLTSTRARTWRSHATSLIVPRSPVTGSPRPRRPRSA